MSEQQPTPESKMPLQAASSLGDKCIVFGCSNHTSQGRFIGVLCGPCHHYITTGKIGCTDSFLGDMAKEIRAMRETIEGAHRVLCDILNNYECGDSVDHNCSTALAKLQPFIKP